jgi:transposase
MMDVMHACCCGLDVHKKFVVACLISRAADGSTHKEIRTFSTMTQELLSMADWLSAAGCSHVAMESTGCYSKPLYNLLEGQFEVLVVNAQHIKAVPGRKTDVKDCEWIAELLRHGLLRASFIPPKPQRQLRDLTRYRSTLVQERARLINRLQATLEDANIKLAAVVSDISGASARKMIEALMAGERDPQVLADLAYGRMRSKRELLAQAVVGNLTDHHVFLLGEQLRHLDELNSAMTRVGAEIARRLLDAAQDEVLELLDSIPGVSRRSAEIILAEIGSDMSRFPSAKHLASWAGMCPGNHESGGRRLSGRTRKGSPWLRQVLVEIAHVAAKTKNTYLSAQYRRIAARRGKKRALIALGHTILTIIFHVLTDRKPYRELGANYFDQLECEWVQKRLVRRLERLGYDVIVQSAPPQSTGRMLPNSG